MTGLNSNNQRVTTKYKPYNSLEVLMLLYSCETLADTERRIQMIKKTPRNANDFVQTAVHQETPLATMGWCKLIFFYF